jgi:hypothetical protein
MYLEITIDIQEFLSTIEKKYNIGNIKPNKIGWYTLS